MSGEAASITSYCMYLTRSIDCNNRMNLKPTPRGRRAAAGLGHRPFGSSAAFGAVPRSIRQRLTLSVAGLYNIYIYMGRSVYQPGGKANDDTCVALYPREVVSGKGRSAVEGLEEGFASTVRLGCEIRRVVLWRRCILFHRALPYTNILIGK